MNVKQVIVMRTDLNMRKGKMIAQGAHASLGVILKYMKTTTVEFPIWNPNTRAYGDSEYIIRKELDIKPDSYLDKWLNGIFTKICVKAKSEEELINLYDQAVKANIPCILIEDSGLTEFKGVKTKTCIAIGPYWEDEINKITGELDLL